jgi:hypothetical protein
MRGRWLWSSGVNGKTTNSLGYTVMFQKKLAATGNNLIREGFEVSVAALSARTNGVRLTQLCHLPRRHSQLAL